MRINLNLYLSALLIIYSLASCQEDKIVGSGGESQSIEAVSLLSDALNVMHEDPDKALDICDQIINISNGPANKYYAGKAKWYKAYIYDELKQDVSKAYYNYNEALKDLGDVDDPSLKMKIFTNLGVLYRFYGQHQKAIENYEAALNLQEELNDKQLSDLYYNYGVALKLAGNRESFEKAEMAFLQSLEHAQRIDDWDNIASIHNQIGLMYKATGDYDMAEIAYKNTIDQFTTNANLHEFVGKAYHGLGVVYMENGDYDKSVDAFHKALTYKKKSGSIFITKYDLGSAYFQSGDTEKAIEQWKSALTENHDKNDIEQVQIYSDLTRALEANDQLEEALGYSRLFEENVKNILSDGQRNNYRTNQVLFADVVREYETFNRPQPGMESRWAIIALFILMIGGTITAFIAVRKSKELKKRAAVISKLRAEFDHIRVD